MRRPLTVAALLPLLLAAAPVPAPPAPPASQPAPALYTITGTAKQSGNTYLIKFALMCLQADGTYDVLSRPALQIENGQRAEVAIGTQTPKITPAGALATQFSGIRITVIKPISSPQISYVAMVVENDVVKWASASTLTPDPPAQTQP
jgi:hypothetical protein